MYLVARFKCLIVQQPFHFFLVFLFLFFYSRASGCRRGQMRILNLLCLTRVLILFVLQIIKISNIGKGINNNNKHPCKTTRLRNKTLQLKSLVPSYLIPYFCSTRDNYYPEFSVYRCHANFYIFTTYGIHKHTIFLTHLIQEVSYYISLFQLFNTIWRVF